MEMIEKNTEIGRFAGLFFEEDGRFRLPFYVKIEESYVSNPLCAGDYSEWADRYDGEAEVIGMGGGYILPASDLLYNRSFDWWFDAWLKFSDELFNLRGENTLLIQAGEEIVTALPYGNLEDLHEKLYQGILMLQEHKKINWKMYDPRNETECPCVDSKGNVVDDCEYCDGSGYIDQSQESYARDDYEADMRMDIKRDLES